MLRTDIPLLLRNKRLEKGLTLEQAGKLLGVSKTTYRDYENEVLLIENIKIEKLIPLAFFLDLLPNQLFNINSPNFKYNLNKSQFKEFVTTLLKNNVNDLNDEDKQYLIKSIELICNRK